MSSESAWILKVELSGEWEECAFHTRGEALQAFTALAADYTLDMQRAVLHRHPLSGIPALERKTALREYVN